MSQHPIPPYASGDAERRSNREARRARVLRGRAITAALSVSGAVALTVAIAASDHGPAGATTNFSPTDSNTRQLQSNPGTPSGAQADPFYGDDGGGGADAGAPSGRAAPHTSSGGS